MLHTSTELTPSSCSSQALPCSLTHARGLAGPVKLTEINQEEVYGPSSVDREEGIIEMGVAYAPGVPSPMEGATTTFEPIVIDGLVVKTGGDSGRGLGCPVQYIKLSSWCAGGPCTSCVLAPRLQLLPRLTGASLFCHCRDPTPVDCKYTGLRFVSKQALEFAAKNK